MNLVNEINSIKLIVELNKRGFYNLEERKKLRVTIKNYETYEDLFISLIDKYKLNYKSIPEHLKRNYKFLKRACVANPRILRDVFCTSFHDFAEVIKLLSAEEVNTIVNKKFGRFTPAMKESILLSKGISFSKTEKTQQTYSV